MTELAMKDTSAWRLLAAMEQEATEDALREFGNLGKAADEAAGLFEKAGRLVGSSTIHAEIKGRTQDERDHDTVMALRNRRDLSFWAKRGTIAVLRLKQLHQTKARAASETLDDGLAKIFTTERLAADAALNDRAQADDWQPEYVPIAEMQATTAWGMLELLYEEATARHAAIVVELGEMARNLSKQDLLGKEDLFSMRRHHIERNMEAYNRTLRELDDQEEWLSDIKRFKLALVNDWDFTRGDITFARTVFAPETLKPDTAPTP